MQQQLYLLDNKLERALNTAKNEIVTTIECLTHKTAHLQKTFATSKRHNFAFKFISDFPRRLESKRFWVEKIELCQ